MTTLKEAIAAGYSVDYLMPTPIAITCAAMFGRRLVYPALMVR